MCSKTGSRPTTSTTPKGKPRAFNEAAISEAVRRINEINLNDGLMRANQSIYALLTLGISLPQSVEGDTRHHSLHYIDWQHPENNTYHLGEEFVVERERSHQTRRPDIVCFVNGIPLAVIECKRPDLQTKDGGLPHEEAVSQQLRNQKEGQIRPLFAYSQLGLVQCQTFHVVWTCPLTAIRLTPAGKQLCRSFGWQVCESEWERLIRLHDGKKQVRHTAAVLTVSLNARRRGWNTLVVPETDYPRFAPNLGIQKNGLRLYVEVELGSRKQKKWILNQRAQGYKALCAKTADSRASLIRECQQLGIGGLATDLDWLVSQRYDPDPRMWVEQWGLPQWFDELEMCWREHEYDDGTI